MRLEELVTWLNTYLHVSDFPQDQSINGLQVEAGKEVERIAFAVDASLETFRKAKKAEADLLVVHHGLYWKNIPPIIAGVMYRRVKLLLTYHISLYACHLPLDAHEEVGNNVEIIRALGFKPEEKIDEVAWCTYAGIGLKELVRRIRKKIVEPYKTQNLCVFNFGMDEVERLVVGSGGGTHHIFALAEGDTFLTGEFSHYGVVYAKESGVNVIVAGHYATETFGVRALARRVEEEFGIPCIFINAPTGV